MLPNGKIQLVVEHIRSCSGCTSYSRTSSRTEAPLRFM